MKALTHISTGALTGLALSAISEADPAASAIVVASCCFGSLLPDIDHCSSAIGRLIKPASFLTQLLFGHRNMMHSPLPYTIAFFCFIINRVSDTGEAIPNFLQMIGVMLGVGSHLTLDMFNPMGIPLLWPFHLRRFSLADFKSGGVVDTVLGIILSILAIYCFFKYTHWL